MKSAFRNAYFALSHSLNPSPYNSLLFSLRSLPAVAISSSPPCLKPETFRSLSAALCTATMAGGEAHVPSSSPSLEKQFDSFRVQLDESGSLRERIRAVVMEIESTTRFMHAGLLLVHQSRPTPGKQIGARYWNFFVKFYEFLGLSFYYEFEKGFYFS